MSDAQASADDDVIAQLRHAIGAIESTSADLVRRSRQKDVPRQSPKGTIPTIISAPGMPDDDDWLSHVPPRFRDGESGFDRRIMEDLAAVGVRCYTLNGLTMVNTVPQGIPIFMDWLIHLEERIPGPETDHRQAIRANLIRNLNDPAARGNSQVIDLLMSQLQRRPPLTGGAPDFAAQALARVSTKNDFARIAQLIEEAAPEVPKGPLIEYMGKVKTPEARAIALQYLDTKWTYYSIKALRAMKAPGVRSRIEPYLQDTNAFIREQARRAMKTLTA